MAVPTYGAAGTYYDGTGTSHNLAAPAGVAANSVVLVVANVGGPPESVITLPAGFTHAENSPVGQGDGIDTSNAYLVVAWHRATGSEAGPYTLGVDSSQYVEAQVHRYEDVVTTGTPFESGAVDTGYLFSTNTSPAVDITTGGTDRLILHATTCWAGGTWTASSGFTKRQQGAVGVASLFDKAQASGGTTGTVQATSTNTNRMTAWLGALLPVGAVPDPSLPRRPIVSTAAVQRALW